MHHHHLTLKQRMLVAALLAVGGIVAWYLTHVEVYFKIAELSAAPFLDKLIFSLGSEA